MKKTLIILLSIFILFSCSKEKTFETENPIIETNNFDLSIESSNTGNTISSGSEKKLKFKNERDGTRFGIGNKLVDIYDNNSLLVNDFPFSCYEECIYPQYSFTGNKIFNEGGYGGGHGGFIDYIEYNLNSKEFGGYHSRYSNSLVFSEYKSNTINNLKNFSIDTYNTFGESINKYSIFSMNMTGGLSRNYIYDSRLELETNEDFITIKNNYEYFIGGKKIILDFEDLENKQEKMSFLYGGGYDNQNFNYYIYLEKQDNKFTLNFNYIKDLEFGEHKKTVKNIGVTSCSGNNSQTYDNEYNLTPDENGNYKYNISEKLNNKCDIPYKINVYYTDGTKETGEYYILFDY